MSFELPAFNPPDFHQPGLKNAPTVEFRRVRKPGVAPEGYHATTVYPEYFQLRKGFWHLIRETRMDCAVVHEHGDVLAARELRRLRRGDEVAVGRGEDGEDGIYVHTDAFDIPALSKDKFKFRMRPTRETSFSIDYDELYDLLEYERRRGFIIWVLGPAIVFDRDSKQAFVRLVESGFVHAIFAGNALATHDIEGALYGTALGQDIYTKEAVRLGHYRHLDAINTVRAAGSIESCVCSGLIGSGVMRAAVLSNVPVILTGSIRDDGPMPEVWGDVYRAQDAMRRYTSRATTVIALATQLHAIAAGNMVPSYRVLENGTVRPVYFYSVDMSEFAVSKLANRGSLTARSILTNVQDFIVTVERGLGSSR